LKAFVFQFKLRLRSYLWSYLSSGLATSRR